tara:strand:+ start:1848 stop:2195 length:348 start_codon:yes stop_codon:yes gene_type:complete
MWDTSAQFSMPATAITDSSTAAIAGTKLEVRGRTIRHSIKKHDIRARISVASPSPTVPDTENRSIRSSMNLSPDTVAHELTDPIAARTPPVKQISHTANSDGDELSLVKGNLIKS